MNKKIERGQSTREQLIAIATRLFGERGYEGASIEAVLRESGVSRGALYHHFASKEALFDAVLDAVEDGVGGEIVAATSGLTDPADALRAGCQAWVRLAGDPVVQQVVLIDAPAVLGWQEWREKETRYAFGLLKGALQALAEAGRLPTELVDVFAHVVLAAVNEIALLIARADDAEAAMRTGEAAVDELLRRLLGTGPGPGSRSIADPG
jgi:AcrR family transcriptional regulator